MLYEEAWREKEKKTQAEEKTKAEFEAHWNSLSKPQRKVRARHIQGYLPHASSGTGRPGKGGEREIEGMYHGHHILPSCSADAIQLSLGPEVASGRSASGMTSCIVCIISYTVFATD